MRFFLTSFAMLLAAAALAPADLVAHYDFDTVGDQAGVPYTDEVTTTGANFATGGSRATFDQNCRRLGTGSLVLKNLGAAEASGNDGATSNNTFDWGATGFNSDVRTIAFWMKAAVTQPDAQPTMVSLRAAGLGNGERFDVRLDAGKLRVELQGGGFTTASVLNDNNWHHVAVVVPLASSTLANVKYYIDGQFTGTMTGTQAINTAPSPLRMGDSLHDNSRDFTGALDDVRLYNEALDDAAVTALYNDGVANLPGILCLTAAASAIVAGESTTLAWEIDPAVTSAGIAPGIGDVLGLTVGGKGTVSVSPAVTTTYTLTVQRGAETVQQSFTVIVAPAEPPVLTADGFIFSGVFQLTASNLVEGTNYRLDFGGDLETLVSSPREVTSFTAAANVRVMLDEAAPAGRGFYRLVTIP